MARLFTSGFETGALVSEGAGAFSGGGTPVFGTGTVRSGAYSLEIQTASSLAESVWFVPTMVTNRDYFLRSYVRISANPANVCYVLAVHNLTTYITSVRLATDGTLGLFDLNGTQVGSSSPALTPGTWYRVELRFRVTSANANTGTLELLVDGAQVAVNAGGAACGTAAPWSPALGLAVAAISTATIYFDDVGLNDDQGASQNTWPGSGKVILLKPISDNARVGFTAGAGATTSLFDAEDNAPPVGVVLASATNTSQIKDATNNSTDTFDANVQSYTTGGVGASDTVTVAQAIAVGGNSTTTSRTLAVSGVSNPACTEGTLAAGATAAGTFPTGWKGLNSATAHAPTVTLGTSPVVRVRKGTASTDSMMYCQMGLYVEYVPVTVQLLPSLRRPRAGLEIGPSDAVYR